MGIIWNLFMQPWKHRDRKFLEANYLLFWVNKDRDSNSFQSHLVMSLRRNLPSFQGNRHRNDLLPSRETFAYIPNNKNNVCCFCILEGMKEWANFPAAPLYQSVSILCFIFCNTQWIHEQLPTGTHYIALWEMRL